MENPYSSDTIASVAGTMFDDEPTIDMQDNLDDTDDFCGPEDDDADESTKDTTAGTRRSSMPLWLASEYASVTRVLRKEMNKTQTKKVPGQPACYEHSSLYMSRPNEYFTTTRSINIDVTNFYAPVWFVWIPHSLIRSQIPCPSCKKHNRTIYLHASGFTQSPRRVVDTDHCEYIIGYRYRCDKCKRNFRGWSPEILDILPASVSRLFSFRLTHRSGLTDRLVNLLRNTFNQGMGPETFTHTIQALHYDRYDKAKELYYNLLVEHKNGMGAHLMLPHPPFSTFSDRSGYAGFIPSAHWFRLFYDELIESWTSEMLPQITMRSLDIGKLDHSFKV